MWKTHKFTSSGGYLCQYHQKNCVKEGASQTVIFLHGWGDHSGRYRSLAERIVSLGYHVILPDFAGHGISDGPRARVGSFDVLLKDMQLLFTQASISTPVILHGHSMGGCLAFHFAVTHPHLVEAIIFNSAALGVSDAIPRWKKMLATLLAGVIPHTALLNLKNAELMTGLQQEQLNYQRDDLIYHGKIEPATGLALLKANLWCEKRYSQLAQPFLVLQGAKDRLVCPQAGKKLLAQTGHPLSRYQEYNARHDLLHEHCAKDVTQLILQWLDKLSETRLAG